MGRPPQNEKNFWAQVKKGNGCWVWQGCRDKDGYGTVTWNYECCKTHRKSFELKFGPIPKELKVLHKSVKFVGVRTTKNAI